MGRITSDKVRTGLFPRTRLTICVRGDFSNVSNVELRKDGAFFNSPKICQQVFYDFVTKSKKPDYLKLVLKRRKRIKNSNLAVGPGGPVSGTFTVTLYLDGARETCFFDAIDYVD